MTSRAKLLILLCIGLVGFLTASPAWAGNGVVGDQVAEATSTGSIHNIIRGGIYKAPTDSGGPCDSITAYLSVGCDVCETTSTIKAAVYLWRGSANNATLVDTTATLTIAAGTNGSAWYSLPTLIHAEIMSDSTYLIVCWSPTDVDNSHLEKHKITSAGDTMSFKSVTFGAWPNPLAGTSTSNTHRVSIYLTYVNDCPTCVSGTGADTTACSFGYATVGTSNSTLEDQIDGGKFTAPSTATCTSIMFYLDFTSDPVGGHTIKCALYTINAGDTTILTNGQTEQLTSSSWADGWRIFKFNAPQPTVTGGQAYYVCGWANAASGNVAGRITTSGGNSVIAKGTTYGSWPSTTGTILGAAYRNSARVFYVCPTSTLKGRRRKMIELGNPG